jgi:acetylcholinesterase
MLVDFAPKTITEDDSKRNIGLSFVPVVEEIYNNHGSDTEKYDEPFLTEHPLDTLRRGNFSKVPFMSGYTSHEAMLFIRS